VSEARWTWNGYFWELLDRFRRLAVVDPPGTWVGLPWRTTEGWEWRVTGGPSGRADACALARLRATRALATGQTDEG
jgi:hypothetical protein